MKEIEIIKPDDWHVHFRDGIILKHVVPETSRHFSRAIIMPNLLPPILSGKDAVIYKKKIIKNIPIKDDFNPLMTIYLTDNTDKIQLEQSYLKKEIFAAKLYPAGATTTSDLGVTNIKNIMGVLEKMSKIGMPLLIHGEVTDKDVDIFDREKIFIEKHFNFICKNLPELKITLEHITTEDAISYIKEANSNIAASITPHHLSFNRNAIFIKGINPHNYCLPILKREKHKNALVKAAISGNQKFFLGTDTAPHLQKDKESSCGCAGIFNATNCMNTLAQIFDNEKSLHMLERFTSINGAKHYDCELNKDKIRLIKSKEPILLQNYISVNKEKIIMFKPDFPVFGKLRQNRVYIYASSYFMWRERTSLA